MDGTKATVLTEGLGSYSTVSLLITLGFGTAGGPFPTSDYVEGRVLLKSKIDGAIEINP